MIPKHYRLVQEHPQSYEIHDDRDGKRFHIAKSGLNLSMHEKLSKIQHFDEGGDVQEESEPISVSASPGSAQIPSNLINPNPGAGFNQVQSPVGQTNPVTNAPDLYGVDPEAYAQANAPAEGITVASNDPETDRQIASSVVSPGVSSAAESAGSGQAATSDPISSQANNSISGLQKERGALSAGANAEAQAGNQTADAYKNYTDQAEKLPTPIDIYNQHKGADETLMKAYMDKSIDPDRYWKNQSTGSKIAAALGVIFGGMGSATTGGPNLAMQSINNAIERDIDAQKNDQGKAMNLWKMNREATQDENQATLATQNQLLLSVKARALQFASAAQGAQAKARIAPVLGQIDQQISMNNFRRSLMESANQGGGFIHADPAQLVPMMVQNPDQQKQVYEEIGRAQNVSANSQKILNAFDQSSKENTVLRTGAGMVRTPGSIMALHQMLLPNFKQIDGTVRQAAMDETFKNITPSPGDTDAKIAMKRQALISWMHSETAAPTAKGAGIDLSKFSSTSANPLASMPPQQRQFAQWAMKNPGNPKARIVLRKLGLANGQ